MDEIFLREIVIVSVSTVDFSFLKRVKLSDSKIMLELPCMGLEIIMRSLAQTAAVVEVSGMKKEGAPKEDNCVGGSNDNFDRNECRVGISEDINT